MSDFAQSVKQQADIVRVIGEYITLKKSGAQNYSGLCPFHGEKTPSFSVHVTRQFYHCFGCGVSGDVFKFVQEIDKVSFPEAVKIVAQKCGIALPKREFSSPEEAAESRLRGRLLELHEQATAFFEEQLKSPEGARAREYLTGRGLKPETIAKFRIGYAPEGFGGLRDRLNGAAPPEVLRTSGLFGFKAQEDGSAGRMYDYFRKRITFPISNEGGRVIAFTARALDSDDPRKYLNSPATPLYSKGEVLFNLDKARQAIRQQNFALLVEGQMDCISVFAAGVTPVLATSGTAFTEQQARLLRRYTTRVVVNFDPDTAGTSAAEKSIALLTEEGFEVRVVTLEGGLDPDRFVRERGIQAYAEALKRALRHSDYLIERARKLFPVRTAQGKVEAVNFLLPHIRRMPHPITQDEFVKDSALHLGIDAALIRAELRKSRTISKPSAGTVTDRGKPLAINHFERAIGNLTGLERSILHVLCTRDNEMHEEVVALLRKHEIIYSRFETHSLIARFLSSDSSSIFELADLSVHERSLLAAIQSGFSMKHLPASNLLAIMRVIAEKESRERARESLNHALSDAVKSMDFTLARRIQAQLQELNEDEKIDL
ncbi:MAG TPA: DNA primase [Acidobacteriaceae bacterium]|jgi:DNA primase